MSPLFKVGKTVLHRLNLFLVGNICFFINSSEIIYIKVHRKRTYEYIYYKQFETLHLKVLKSLSLLCFIF